MRILFGNRSLRVRQHDPDRKPTYWGHDPINMNCTLNAGNNRDVEFIMNPLRATSQRVSFELERNWLKVDDKEFHDVNYRFGSSGQNS